MTTFTQFTTHCFKNNTWSVQKTNIIIEKSLLLTVNDHPLLDFMCTPIDIENLVIGFLFTERHINAANEIKSIEICGNLDQVDVWLNHSIEDGLHWVRTAGCAGGYSRLELERDELYQPVPEEQINTITPKDINSLVSQLFHIQAIYRDTGGIHTSALSDGTTILYAAEDIGRHNTIDKIAGMMLRNSLRIPTMVITTGRVSSEMMKKMIKMRISVVISRTSPTALSIKHAQNAGVTLIGYARRDGFIVYTHPERLIR
jgi:FdhD protein